MPRDTVWINNTGSYLIAETNSAEPGILVLSFNPLDSNSNYDRIRYSFNPKNSKFADSVLENISLLNNLTLENARFRESNKNDEKVFGFAELFIILIAILVGYYAYRRAEKYKENPFDEDERDWVEIGSSPRNNYGRSSDEDSIIYRKPAPKPLKEYLTYNGWDLKFSEAQVVAAWHS
jgi:hypothetical protein